MLAGLKPHLVQPQLDVGVDTYTKSLLHFNGQFSSQNFADFSNRIWTAGNYAELGNIPQGGYGCLDLRAGNGWIDTPAHIDLDVKTEEFTIECFVYALNSGTYKYVFGQGDSSASAGTLSMFCRFETDDRLMATFSIGGSGYAVYSAAAVSMGAWHHVAIVRQGDTLYLYLDGVKQGSGTALPAGGSVLSSSNKFTIGALGEYHGAYFYVGVIDEFRFSKGVARYTADFTPRTYQEFGYPGNDGYTTLMMYFDGENGDTGSKGGLIDSSAVGVAAYRGHARSFGSAAISNNTAKFGGTSLYIPSGGYLLWPSSTDFDFGAGDFTVDWWDYFPSTPAENSVIIARDSDGVTYTPFMFGYCTSGVMYAYIGDGATWTLSNLPLGQTNTAAWRHRAVVRSGNILSGYQNGIRQGAAAISGSIPASSGNLGIGRWISISALVGYVDALRISKGIARWLNDFVPPISPYAQGGVGGTDGNTKLLLHFEGPSGGTTFLDHSGYGRTVTGNGSIALASSPVKMGKGSLAFNGSTQYATVAHSSDWEFGSGNFTVEWWEYRTGGGCAIARDFSTLYCPFLFSYGSTRLVYMCSAAGSWDIANGRSFGTVTNNVWQHLAITRNGTVFRTFLNGVQQDSWTSSASLAANSNPLCIGAAQSGTYFSGYMDDLRITKGVSRYDANFTAPEAPFPT
jgi:hypothetical protein